MRVLTITKDNFQEEVLQAEGKVLIDFWATWCGPCRMLSPVVDEIAEEAAEGLKVGKVNVDEQPELAQQYQIMTIPNLIVFKDGQAVAQSIGLKPKQEILALIEEA
ncbi:MAG: thioredoxin [Firmicutes bacterium]|nr:thioredoxin [Bacillota bacterium]